MSELTLEQKTNRKLSEAFVVLFVIALLVNIGVLVIDVKTITGNILDTFTHQVSNVARVGSQRGDIISLQRDLESVALPLAQTFPIDIDIYRKNDHKALVSIESEKKGVVKIFNKKVFASLEVNPFGTLEAVILFDLSQMIWLGIFKSFVSIFTLIIALVVMRSYIGNQNHINLSPIDQFSTWIERVPIDEFINCEAKMPTDGLSSELSSGFRKLIGKIQNLSSEVAALEANRRVGVLARRVAHDIRSPLSALNILSKSLKSKLPEESAMLDEVSSRIILIAEDLLGQTREVVHIEKESISANFKEGKSYSFEEIVKACESIFKEKQVGMPLGSRINLGFFSEDMGDGNFNCDLGELQRIVSNLLNNALEATEVGFVSLNLSLDLSKLLIEVRDSGKGMPQELISKIYQSPATEGKDNGNGLGLFSAIHAVSSWGGELVIHSQVNRGTTVSLKLITAE